MKAVIKKVLQGREIVHYASLELKIYSLANKIFVEKGGEKRVIEIPEKSRINKLLNSSRICRRVLRLDKCNVFPVKENLIIIRQGRVWQYLWKNKKLKESMRLENGRCLLYQAIALSDDNRIYFGEYANFKTHKYRDVPVYVSKDQGESWSKIFVFSAGKIRHVHGCHWDPYEGKIWIFTGDFKGECLILVADKEFNNIEWIGDGSQKYRICNVFFEKDHVHWFTDTPLENNYHVILNRKDRRVESMAQFPGPVWYVKRLTDGYSLVATTCESGPGVKNDYSSLYCSKDLKHWTKILMFKKDILPKRLFKYGIIGFADGEQSSKEFYICLEAVKGFDGKVAVCSIVD